MADNPSSFEESCHQLNAIIQAASRAAEFHNYHGLLMNFGELRQRLRNPDLLDFALGSTQLVDVTRFCLWNDSIDVRQAALNVFLTGLDSIGMVWCDPNRRSDRGGDAVVATTLLSVIEAHVLNVAVRSDVFKQAFDGLGRWCALGKHHRDLFLVVFPIERLLRYDIFHYPSDVLNSYCYLVRTILSEGRSNEPLFGPVLEIFQNVISCSEGMCYYPRILSESIRESLREFEVENSIEGVISSSFINLVVRHAMSKETCDGYCRHAIMELIAECLAGRNNSCQRLVDQGILNLIGVCLDRDPFRTLKHACTALAIVFANSSENIDNALHNDLVGPLFALRDCHKGGMEEKARNALLQFFARATPKQIFTLFEQDHCRAIVNLLYSAEMSVQFDGLSWLFALVNATRTHAPNELPKLRERMLELDAKEACEKLADHEAFEVIPCAQDLINLMNTHSEEILSDIRGLQRSFSTIHFHFGSGTDFS